MNEYIASLLRHAFTGLAGLGGLLLANNLIGAADVPAVDAAGATLGSALVVIGTAMLGRLIITLTNKLFRHGAGETGGNSPRSGGGAVCVCISTAAIFFGLGLPSCSNAPPLRACLTWHDVTACVSPAGDK